jgi:hypothetical protein
VFVFLTLAKIQGNHQKNKLPQSVSYSSSIASIVISSGSHVAISLTIAGAFLTVASNISVDILIPLFNHLNCSRASSAFIKAFQALVTQGIFDNHLGIVITVLLQPVQSISAISHAMSHSSAGLIYKASLLS